MLSGRKLADFVRQQGPRNYLRTQARLLGLRENGSMPTDHNGKAVLAESVEIGGKKQHRMRPEDFSFRALWEGLVGPAEETLQGASGDMGFMESGMTEEVSTAAFQSAIGQLISTKVIEGYEDDAGFIGDQLVQPMPSNLRGERIVGFTHLQGPKVVGEGQQYEDSDFGDKYVGSRETKRGRLLSITEEAIIFDQTGQALRRAQNFGSTARQERERRIVRAVINADSGEAVYQPSGTKEQLYSSGNNNLLSTATPLVDWTDISEVMTYHALNTTDDRETDDTLSGQPIVWMPKILLTAVELRGQALRILTSTEQRGPAAAEQAITGNMANQLVPGMTALSSVFIDNATDGDQWDDSSDWLLGDFQKQFAYKEIWPLRVLSAPSTNEEAWNRDIVARFKVSEYGDVIALDERWVVKVNAV